MGSEPLVILVMHLTCKWCMVNDDKQKCSTCAFKQVMLNAANVTQVYVSSSPFLLFYLNTVVLVVRTCFCCTCSTPHTNYDTTVFLNLVLKVQVFTVVIIYFHNKIIKCMLIV